MLYFVCAAIILVLGKFLLDLTRQNNSIGKSGGMLVKYDVLCNYIKDYMITQNNGSPDYKNVFGSSLEIVDSGKIDGYELYKITESFGKIIVQWFYEDSRLGEYGLEWSFKDSEDQKEIARVVIPEIYSYMKDLKMASLSVHFKKPEKKNK